jgi:nickel superoxide dismutase
MSIKSAIRNLLHIQDAHAHCDIPCGIYDPITAKIAAQTVLKMTMRIKAMEGATASTAEERQNYANAIGRYIVVKEEHAEICKHDLDVLWHDYFRPDHLEKYTDLHDKFWKTTKLASQCKQSVNLDAARQLVSAVDDIATIYWATKNVEYKDPVADVRFGT